MLRIAYPRSSEGPSPETCRRRSGEWRPAAAARNQGPGRSGTPPARHYDLAARSSLHKSGRNAGDGSAAPDRKSPRWSAEEASASRRTRAAPQSARIVAPDSATTEILRLSALRPPPHGADGKEKSKTRAQKRAAGTKKTALFDIVKRSVAATRSVPAEGAPRRVIGPMEGERGPRGTACRACVDTATNAPNPKFAHTVGQMRSRTPGSDHERHVSKTALAEGVSLFLAPGAYRNSPHKCTPPLGFFRFWLFAARSLWSDIVRSSSMAAPVVLPVAPRVRRKDLQQ